MKLAFCWEYDMIKMFSSGFEPGVFNQAIADQGFTQNTSKLFRQFRWNLVCGSYLAQGE